jgi:beta-lactamase superfamily II metal-dependent hydrolase
VAIISVGPNGYGHPAPEVLERLEGAEVMRTDEEGSIEVACDLAACQIRRVR